MKDNMEEAVSSPTHLLILQHGLHGSSLDLLYTQNAFDSNHKGKVLTVSCYNENENQIKSSSM